MNLKSTLLATVLGLFLVIPSFNAEASSVIRTGESISVENDQKIDGDFYSLANILNVSGEIAGDMTSIGRKVTINGSVANDALLAGESVDVHGGIGDDLRVVGGDIIIAKPVTGDVFAIGGSVTVLSTGSVGGDIIIYAGEADISGSVGGNVLGQAGSLRIDAPVKGNVDVTTEKFVIGDRADIGGTVRYVSIETLDRSQNAKIAGDVTRSDPVVEKGDFNHKTILVPVLMLIFSTLVWYLLARTLVTKIVERSLVRGIRPLATGFIFLIAGPVVIITLLVSVLGTLVGVTALIAYLFAILISLFTLGAVIGQLLMNTYKKQNVPLSPFTLVIGVTGLCLLAIIPIVGPLVIIGLLMVTVGALVDLVLHPQS